MASDSLYARRSHHLTMGFLGFLTTMVLVAVLLSARVLQPADTRAVAAASVVSGDYRLTLYELPLASCPSTGGRLVNSADLAGNVVLTGCWWRKDAQVGICWADFDCVVYEAGVFTWGAAR